MVRPKRSKEKVFDPAFVTHCLEVKGAVNHPLRLTAEELGAMELTEVRDVNMICGSGRNEGFIESYRGVRLTEVLNRADVIMRVHDSPNYLYVTAMSSDGRWALNINTGSTGNIIRNNILLHTLTYRGSIVVDATSRSGLSSDYNLCSGPFSRDGDETLLTLTQWRALGYDTHSALATAATIFVNPSGGNYRPKSPGSAIDKGTSQYAPTKDLLNRARPAGAGYDIGCYEGP